MKTWRLIVMVVLIALGTGMPAISSHTIFRSANAPAIGVIHSGAGSCSSGGC